MTMNNVGGNIMRFSEMQYVRPDVESIKEQSERIKLDFSSADSL